MSVKAKDLSYEAQEPAFLRRLRGQQQGLDSDRHEQPIARPRRAKAADEEEAPTYVDETTNETLSKEEYEAMVAGESTDSIDPVRPVQPTQDAIHPPKSEDVFTKDSRVNQETSAIGASQRKRKAIKVVVADDDQDSNVQRAEDQKKQKRKGKAVKLSFGTDDP